MKIISKELASEVLNEKIILIDDKYASSTNRVRYVKNDNNDFYINIYELTHKCKEWAYDKNWIIIESSFSVVLKNRTTGKIINFFYGEEDYKKTRFGPKYTFKACQWILDNSTH